MSTVQSLKTTAARVNVFTDAMVKAKIVESGEQIAANATAWPTVFMTVTELASQGKLTLDDKSDKLPAKSNVKITGKKTGGAKTKIDDAYFYVEDMAVAFNNKAGFGLTMAKETMDKAKSELRLAINLGSLETVGINGVALLAKTASSRDDNSKQIYECFKSAATAQMEHVTRDKKTGKVTAAVALTTDELKVAIKKPDAKVSTTDTVWIGVGDTLSALVEGTRKDKVKETDKARIALAAQVIALAGNLKDAIEAAKEAEIQAKKNAERAAAKAKRDADAAIAAKVPSPVPVKSAASKRKVPTKRGK